jgi:SAM-dependent methyltransferase
MNTESHTSPTPPARRYQAGRMAHWDAVAANGRDASSGMRGCYQGHLRRQYRFLVPEGQRVLEIGCAEGDLLAALKPEFGVGVDFSEAMLDQAKSRHPGLRFFQADAHELEPGLALELFDQPFDAIILADLVNDAWDVLKLLNRLTAFCASHTRLILNFHSHLWEHPFQLLQKTGRVTPRLPQNWLTPADLSNLLDLAGFEVVRGFDDFLWPWNTPVIEPMCNRFLAKIRPFSFFDLTHFLVCRPAALHCWAWPGNHAPAQPHSQPQAQPVVSVVIPARNEAGNIEAALQRTPEMGAGTEIIFVEGHSTDNTWETIQTMAEAYDHRRIKALRQPGRGKGDAVRAGFDAAQGDILMILDADLTMPPETLPQFYEAIASGKAEFVNGVRLVYPQEKKAMRFVNLLGNKFFSLAFSWLLGRSIKDTLCGTKVLSRENYRKIAANRSYFGEFDPFGDFDLLFGAAKLNLKIMDLPVRYQERTYGDTNISRWRDGWLLLRMVAFAARRIKFAP